MNRGSRQNLRPAKISASERWRRTYLALGIETTVKLGINLAVAGISISALTQLIPYYLSGREKLGQLEAEVERTENHVREKRTQFSYYFDPQQAKSIMQQESNLTDPTQKRVVFVKPQTASSGE
ncbi:MAG: hypothetical protein D6728_09325 [Cyanobacteria bacterium J055]|nr:MAG: hypothetical protein D6728_09325 [Cyanobacteria bacterium J055]